MGTHLFGARVSSGREDSGVQGSRQKRCLAVGRPKKTDYEAPPLGLRGPSTNGASWFLVDMISALEKVRIGQQSQTNGVPRAVPRKTSALLVFAWKTAKL